MTIRSYEISVSGNLGTLSDAFRPHRVQFEDGASTIRVERVDQATGI